MEIEWFGHSCFRINNSLVIDPYKDGSIPGYAPLRLDADKVVCTHEHADHAGRECVRLTGSDCSLAITPISSWHDDQNGALRGANTIYIISDGEKKLVHLGDLGHFPNDEQLLAISNADYLLQSADIIRLMARWRQKFAKQRSQNILSRCITVGTTMATMR